MSYDRIIENRLSWSPRRSVVPGALTLLTGAAVLLAACSSTPSEPGNGGILKAGDGGVAPMAVAKFCHELNRSGRSIDLRLELGSPPLVQVTASTETCSPPLGMPCTSIPVGVVPVKLFEGDTLLASSVLN